MSDLVLITEDGDVLVDEYGDALVWGDASPVVPHRAVRESRLRQGALWLGPGGDSGTPYQFACQATAVRLVPSTETVGSDVTTVCGRTIRAGHRTTWTLQADVLQDWDDPAGLTLYSHEHNGRVNGFVWQPTPESRSWTGAVRVRALGIGGDVGTRLRSSFSWDLVSAPALVSVTES